MSNEEILKLIELMSPHAKDYVHEGFQNEKVEVIYSTYTEKNKGAFIMVDNDDCCIFYASFLNEDNIEEVLEVINTKVQEYILKNNSKELCFNVYGKDLKIIKLVRELGFKSDIEGYHFEYRGKEVPLLNDCGLIVKGFQSSMLDEFVNLFDSAYYKLNIDNGWKVNSNAVYKEGFNKELNDFNKVNQVCSFWLNNELVGAYIIQQNYISDIVVKPEFQNKGYGSYILAYCIRDMKVNKAINNIRLRVAKSNALAKNLYERNGFVEIANFAEHTYE